MVVMTVNMVVMTVNLLLRKTEYLAADMQQSVHRWNETDAEK